MGALGADIDALLAVLDDPVQRRAANHSLCAVGWESLFPIDAGSRLRRRSEYDQRAIGRWTGGKRALLRIWRRGAWNEVGVVGRSMHSSSSQSSSGNCHCLQSVWRRRSPVPSGACVPDPTPDESGADALTGMVREESGITPFLKDADVNIVAGWSLICVEAGTAANTLRPGGSNPSERFGRKHHAQPDQTLRGRKLHDDRRRDAHWRAGREWCDRMVPGLGRIVLRTVESEPRRVVGRNRRYHIRSYADTISFFRLVAPFSRWRLHFGVLALPIASPVRFPVMLG